MFHLNGRRRPVTDRPAEIETVPLAELDPAVAEPSHAELLDAWVRNDAAVRLIAALLRTGLDRTSPRDALLDIRNVLHPEPPLPLRPSVPAGPGWS